MPQSDNDILSMIGLITIDWNNVEQFIDRLIHIYLGNDNRGWAVTAHIGNVTRINILQSLVHLCENDKVGADSINHACKAFSILSQNRNMIAHSFGIAQDTVTGEHKLIREPNKVTGDAFLSVKAGPDDLKKIIAHMDELREFLHKIEWILIFRRMKKNKGKRPPWPDKFPLPSILTPLPIDAQGKKPQPQSSLE